MYFSLLSLLSSLFSNMLRRIIQIKVKREKRKVSVSACADLFFIPASPAFLPLRGLYIGGGFHSNLPRASKSFKNFCKARGIILPYYCFI